MADRQSDPSGWLAAHFAGRWQTIRHTNLCLLMTLKHETKLYAGPSDLCESISKIILFAVATHFRLPPPITALSGDDDRLELRAARGASVQSGTSAPGDPNPCPHQHRCVIYMDGTARPRHRPHWGPPLKRTGLRFVHLSPRSAHGLRGNDCAAAAFCTQATKNK